MAGNSFGELFRITTFGESHGPGIGVVVDGCPSNISIDEKRIAGGLARRRPGQSSVTTKRYEGEKFEILSGVLDGKTTGAPVAVLIRNEDARPQDYSRLKDVYRPSHADFTYSEKYGIRDHRGGGRASARETAARVAAGEIARMMLEQLAGAISIVAYVHSIGSIRMEEPSRNPSRSEIEASIVRCPDKKASAEMVRLIHRLRDEGDSTGGEITCICSGFPAGLGEPVFDKLHAMLGHAMLSIPAVKGFETGSGFSSSSMTGSVHNDAFVSSGKKIHTLTNNSGGIQGGISNGEDIFFRVGFKPASTIAKAQRTVNVKSRRVVLEATGRHDPCVVPRAVPIVEAMAALVLADMFLLQRARTTKKR